MFVVFLYDGFVCMFPDSGTFIYTSVGWYYKLHICRNSQIYCHNRFYGIQTRYTNAGIIQYWTILLSVWSQVHMPLSSIYYKYIPLCTYIFLKNPSVRSISTIFFSVFFNAYFVKCSVVYLPTHLSFSALLYSLSPLLPCSLDWKMQRIASNTIYFGY